MLANPVLPRSGSREAEVRFSPQKPPRSCQTRETPCLHTKSFLISPRASAFSPAPSPEDLHTPTHSLTGDTWAERLPISPRQGHLVTNEFVGAVAIGKCLPRDLAVVSLAEETQPLGMSWHQDFSLSPASWGTGWWEAAGRGSTHRCLTTCRPESAAETEQPGSSGWEHAQCTQITFQPAALLCFLYWYFHSDGSNTKGNKVSTHLQIRVILSSCPRIDRNGLNIKEPRWSPASGPEECVCTYTQIQTTSSFPLSSSPSWSCLQSLPCQNCSLRKQCLSPALT